MNSVTRHVLRTVTCAALIVTTCLTIPAADGTIEGTLTAPFIHATGKTVIVFTQTTAARSGCQDQRLDDLGSPPMKPSAGLLDINILEPIPDARRSRFVTQADHDGHFRIELPLGSYTAVVEQRSNDVFFDGSSWVAHQTCQTLPGVFASGQTTARHLHLHLTDN